MNTQNKIKQRLEYLRGELRAERISYDDLHELQSLAAYIEPGDVELLEPAGVPETAAQTKPHAFEVIRRRKRKRSFNLVQTFVNTSRDELPGMHTEYDSSEYDTEAIEIDKRNGNFSEDNLEDYRHENIVRASLVNGQFSQARKQCLSYGLDYNEEKAKWMRENDWFRTRGE